MVAEKRVFALRGEGVIGRRSQVHLANGSMELIKHSCPFSYMWSVEHAGRPFQSKLVSFPRVFVWSNFWGYALIFRLLFGVLIQVSLQ